jgi:hypothetical protein
MQSADLPRARLASNNYLERTVHEGDHKDVLINISKNEDDIKLSDARGP